MTTKKLGSISRDGFDESVGAKRYHNGFHVMPSKIRADHYNDNHDRAALYSLAGQLPELAGHPAIADDRICFTRAEVLARVESFKRVGQEEPVKVYRSATGLPDLSAGFLRHLAGLYLEVSGELATCPDMAHGLRIIGTEAPTDSITIVEKSRAENERKETTAVDKAWLCRRYEALGLDRAAIAAKLGVSERMVARYFQLLLQPPQVLLDVHEGRRSMMDAIKEASDKGKHGGKGKRPYASMKTVAVALDIADKRPLPSKGLRAAEIRELLELFAGGSVNEDTSDVVREWYDAVTPTNEEIKAIKASAKADKPKPPRRVGRKQDADASAKVEAEATDLHAGDPMK